MNKQLDPNEGDAVVLWAEIARLRAAIQGPAGYDSWQDAATAERVRRVQAEKAVEAAHEAGRQLGMEQALAELAKTSEAGGEIGKPYESPNYVRDKVRGDLKSLVEAFEPNPQPAAERVALTGEKINGVYRKCRISFSVPDDSDRYPSTWLNTDELKRLIRAIEAEHGIGQQAKEQT